VETKTLNQKKNNALNEERKEVNKK